MSSTTFRHTEKALQKIKETMNKEGLNKTQAILFLIEREAPSQPQLEHSTEGNYFQYPPFLYCPNDRTWLSKDTLLTDKQAGCNICKSKKSCPAWRLKELF